jgi:hypothetical protein
MFFLGGGDGFSGAIENDESRTGSALVDCSNVGGHGSLRRGAVWVIAEQIAISK